MASTSEEATPSLYSEIDVKEEPILTDSCHQQPMEELEQIYIKEENIKLEIADDLDAHDPLQLEEEKRGHESSIDKGSTYDVVDNGGTYDVVGTDSIMGNVGADGVAGNVGTDVDAGNVGAGNVGADGVRGNVGADGVAGKIPKKRGRPRNIWPCGNGRDNNVDDVALKRRKELRNEVQQTNGSSESESIIPATCNTCGGSGRLGARDVPPTEFGNATRSTVEEGEVPSSTSQHLEPSSSVCKGTVAHLQDLMEDNHMDSLSCSECHIPLPECEVCHRVCQSHTALRVHSAMHTGKPPFTCSVCLKQFSRKFSLKVHSRVHTEKPPPLFTCSVCLKPFLRKVNLEVHSRLHTEKELYACVICPKKFTQAFHYEAHLRAHYGRRLHSCRVCNKTFSLRCKQNNHSQTHWGAVISL